MVGNRGPRVFRVHPLHNYITVNIQNAKQKTIFHLPCHCHFREVVYRQLYGKRASRPLYLNVIDVKNDYPIWPRDFFDQSIVTWADKSSSVWSPSSRHSSAEDDSYTHDTRNTGPYNTGESLRTDWNTRVAR